ncbi:synaptotagmin-like protein 2 isoform X2 [Tachysurus fulvidraco]|uniref:synaptotagmin-like protein 2 isoform X2 n=1 Tax=Tachysurus fulvidraco TaxID=1234273 RepID=UPI001FEDC935|nr:synaptotagmin-like protein 2 isoform X2 [Tachysurus fulvidraco]
MIDLSYLNEEEQEAIMAVLKRDAELKKAEEERVKHLQEQGPEEGKLKYITGEWFYEVKSQRHQDRIHGSDIIIASMKQKKPMTVEFSTQSWRERPNKANNDLMAPHPKSTDKLKERRPTETQQESRNRQRHNPFNNIPMDLDYDVTIGASVPETKNPPEVDSSLNQEGSEIDAKPKDFHILPEKPPRLKPVPKKRTKIFNVQNSPADSTSSISSQSVSTNTSVSTQSASTCSSTMSPVSTQSMSTNSDSRSTLSTQSMSTNSEIRSLPPKGILKHSSSCSSSDSNIKSRLPQPRKTLNVASTKTGHEHILEENAVTQESIEESSLNLKDKEPLKPTSPQKSAFPTSRLPVRSSVVLNNPTQTDKEKPNIQPRLSLSSSTQSNDEQKTEGILDNKQQCEKSSSWLTSAEPEKQNIAVGMMKEPLSIPRARAKSPYEALLAKPLKQSINPQILLKNQEKEDSKASKRENEKTEEKLDHPLSIRDQQAYEASNPTNACNRTDPSFATCESDYMPCPFDMKITRGTNNKTEDCTNPRMAKLRSPKASEEQGDSIAKVLEWFSRSSDSSDKLDYEGILPDTEDDIRIEDIDFDNETNSRPNAENNVYLIIPRHMHEDRAMTNDVFLNKSDLAVEKDKKEASMNSQAVQDLIDQTKPLSTEEISAIGSSSLFRHRSPQDTSIRLLDPEKTTPKEKELETADKNKEILDNNPNQHELQGLKVSHSPKIANVQSLWERGTIEEPVMLLSKPNINSEKENIDQNNFGRKVIEFKEEPTKTDISPKYSVNENKKYVNKSHVKNISNVVEIQADDIIYEHLNKKEDSDRDTSKDIQAPMSNINQIKDIMAPSSTSDMDVNKCLDQKSSSSIDLSLQIGDHSNDNVGGNDNSEEGCATVQELDQKIKTEEKESQLNPTPTSSVPSQQENPVSVAKKSIQQQNNKAERIKELKSFWEKEKLQSNVCKKSPAANDTNSSVTFTKLNKRFTKSEYDLSTINTESEAETFNFTVLPLRDRIEKTVTGEGINSLQFKMLRDFWAGSSKQSYNFENKIHKQLSQDGKQAKTHKELNQLEHVDAKLFQTEKRFGNDNGNTMSMTSETERQLQSFSKEKTVDKCPDTANLHISPTEPDVLRSSHCPEPKSGLKLSPKDTSSPKTPEFQPQTRSTGKGTLNGRGNSLRRATSMFAINMESQGENLPLQPKKVSDTVHPQLGEMPESTVLSSTKTPEVYLQPKKSPEITKSKHSATDRSTSEDPDSQPLARSFVSGDNRGKDISPQARPQKKSELVCSSFQTDGSVKCCLENADNPIDAAELCTRRGSWGHASEDNPETLNRVDSFSGTSANFTEVSLVQEALRRASTRPVYHKSLEDITAVPRQSKKSKHMDDFMTSSYAISSTPSPASSSFSDKEHLRKISKSVPNFLENENDGDESDLESSSHSGKHRKNSSPQAKLKSHSRISAVPSMSRSIISISSADFGNVEVQGTIQFSISYVQKLREFHIFVVQCQNLAAVDVKRNRSDPYVKSYLIPDTANLGKRKTSVKKKNLNPTYNEILRYRVQMEYLKTQILNLSVWHNDTFGRNTFLGETEIDLSKWDFGSPWINCLYLKPRNTSSILSTDERGEMRLAIRFLPHISLSKSALGSGEIHIWVRDCRNLPLIRGVTINPYAKCYVLPDTSKKSCQKTRVLKRTASPVFNHTMVYDGFRTEDLKEACVELTVWDRDRLTDHLVGGLRLGLGTGQSYGTKVDWMDSVAKEAALWQRMMDSPNEWVEDVLPLRIMTVAKHI